MKKLRWTLGTTLPVIVSTKPIGWKGKGRDWDWDIQEFSGGDVMRKRDVELEIDANYYSSDYVDTLGERRDLGWDIQEFSGGDVMRKRDVELEIDANYYSSDYVDTLGESSSHQYLNRRENGKNVPVYYEYNATTGQWEETNSWHLNGVQGEDVHSLDSDQPDNGFQQAIDSGQGSSSSVPNLQGDSVISTDNPTPTTVSSVPTTTTSPTTKATSTHTSSSFSITVPNGWTPPKRGSNLYASHIISGVSVVLAVMIAGLIIAVVGWRKKWSFGVGMWGKKKAKEKKLEADAEGTDGKGGRGGNGKKRKKSAAVDKFRAALRRRKNAKREVERRNASRDSFEPATTSTLALRPVIAVSEASRPGSRLSTQSELPCPSVQGTTLHPLSSSRPSLSRSSSHTHSHLSSTGSRRGPDHNDISPDSSPLLPPATFPANPPAYINSSPASSSLIASNLSSEKCRYSSEEQSGSGSTFDRSTPFPPPTIDVPNQDEAPPPPDPSPSHAVGITGHIATDDKTILSRMFASGSRPEDEEELIGTSSTPVVSAPNLEVDDDGFEIVVTSPEASSSIAASAAASTSNAFPLPPAPFAMPTYTLSHPPRPHPHSSSLTHFVAQGFPSAPEYDGPMTSRREEKRRALEAEAEQDWRFRPSAPEEEGDILDEEEAEVIPSAPERESMEPDRGFLPMYEPSAPSAPPMVEEQLEGPTAPPWNESDGGEEEGAERPRSWHSTSTDHSLRRRDGSLRDECADV
ncbi:hypothetical protein BT69DRAFT_263273 [Atractiella rhizophila]|nr:hypothetical protein BT69DRAFT_263273 [Atractiella rhizophila]